MKLHRIVINMALVSTSAMRLDSQKAKKWDRTIKATFLRLTLLISKLKSHVVRIKRNIQDFGLTKIGQIMEYVFLNLSNANELDIVDVFVARIYCNIILVYNFS